MHSIANRVKEEMENPQRMNVKVIQECAREMAQRKQHGQLVRILHGFSSIAQTFENRQKFIIIVDSLLKIDSYRYILSSSVVIDIFVRYFTTAHFERNFCELQALKLIRNSWRRCLPLPCLEQMRRAAYQHTGVDVQYTDFAELIPRSKYSPSRSPNLSTSSRVTEDSRRKSPQKQAKCELELSVIESDDSRKRVPSETAKPGYDSKLVGVEPSPTQEIASTVKRERQITDEDNGERLRKVRKEGVIAVEQSFRQKLERLRGMNDMKCHQCAKSFITVAHYDKHMIEHLHISRKEIILNRIKIKNRPYRYTDKTPKLDPDLSKRQNRPMLPNVQAWIGVDSSDEQAQEQKDNRENSQETSEIKYQAPLRLPQEELADNQTCKLCGKQHFVTNDVDGWLIKGGIRATIQNSDTIVHSDCYKHTLSLVID